MACSSKISILRLLSDGERVSSGRGTFSMCLSGATVSPKGAPLGLTEPRSVEAPGAQRMVASFLSEVGVWSTVMAVNPEVGLPAGASVLRGRVGAEEGLGVRRSQIHLQPPQHLDLVASFLESGNVAEFH